MGATEKAQNWTYVEETVAEPEEIAQARTRAEELGVTSIEPGIGVLLATIAAASQAHHVVEVGTGAGVSGSWLLSGMPAGGVLTTIDSDASYQRSARTAFTQVQAGRGNARVIGGRALEVLPRLADGGYDLVLLDADIAELEDLVTQAARLLRDGGTLIIPRALWQDRVADPARRDESTVAMRETVRGLLSSPEWIASLVPVGSGVVVAVKR